ncbi:MAG: hypothetical protein EOM24_22205, partial [Chloroflexia bacterium]|nr:hypothetical protein [Chloroflexia bacterium]
FTRTAVQIYFAELEEQGLSVSDRARRKAALNGFARWLIEEQRLLQISLVYVNTLMIQEVLAEPVWEARLTSDDRRGLTPLVDQHVSPYGVFELDLTTRLPLREPVLAA